MCTEKIIWTEKAANADGRIYGARSASKDWTNNNPIRREAPETRRTARIRSHEQMDCAGYGEPLRKFFGETAWVEQVIDFGHAKQIFPDADVFPSILVARKPANVSTPASVRVCAIPREQLCIDDLSRQIKSEGFDVPRDRLEPNRGAWSPLV